MRWVPKSLVGRNALFVTLILALNEALWLGVVRPLVFNRFVQPNEAYHPNGMLRVYVELEWSVFALLISTIGVYILFFWLRRQLQSLVGAARALGDGQAIAPLPETGPEEIRELSRGFNQLALNLEALDADRRLMLAGISHDLSTPLTRLRLALELMQMKNNTGEVANMIRDVEDINAILLQFTDYARSGKEEVPVKGDFNEIVADVCQRYLGAGHVIRVDLESIPLFDFKPLAIRRLTANLIDNAVRYGREPIDLRTRVDGGEIVLSVLDSGPGIQSVEPNRLIQPFTREDTSRGSRLGAGLGLSIVERITHSHGGRLLLSNRAGGGLEVTVTLPIHQADSMEQCSLLRQSDHGPLR